MLAHDRDLGDDSFTSPFDTENFGELLEVFSGCFSY